MFLPPNVFFFFLFLFLGKSPKFRFSYLSPPPLPALPVSSGEIQSHSITLKSPVHLPVSTSTDLFRVTTLIFASKTSILFLSCRGSPAYSEELLFGSDGFQPKKPNHSQKKKKKRLLGNVFHLGFGGRDEAHGKEHEGTEPSLLFSS